MAAAVVTMEVAVTAGRDRCGGREWWMSVVAGVGGDERWGSEGKKEKERTDANVHTWRSRDFDRARTTAENGRL